MKRNYDPTTANNKTIHKVISRFLKENLSKNISKGVKTENPKTPHFYLKPKVHKEGNPGRPVISSVNCCTSNISKYVDYHFQPIVKEISSYVQDTTDFLRKINQIDFVPDNSYLASLPDVKLLYINTPNAEGIKSVKTFFEKYISNYCILSVKTNIKQLTFHGKNPDKRLRHKKNLCTLIHKYFYGPL